MTQPHFKSPQTSLPATPDSDRESTTQIAKPEQFYKGFRRGNRLSVRPLAVPYQGISPYRLLLRHMWIHFRLYSAGMIFVLLGSLVAGAIPKLVQWTIEILSSQYSGMAWGHLPQREALQLMIAGLASLLVVQWLAQRYWRLTLGHESNMIGADLKFAVWDRVRFFPSVRLHTDLTKGVLMNIATGDVGSARVAFGWTLLAIADCSFQIVIAGAALLLIQPKLALLCGASLLVVPWLAYRRSVSSLDQYHRSQEVLSVLNETAAQAVATVKLQRLSQTHQTWLNKLLKTAEQYRTTKLSEAYTNAGFILTMGLPPLVGYAVFYWLASQLLISGQMNVGKFVAFHAYLTMLMSPLGDIGFFIADWQKGIGGLKRLTELYREQDASELYFPEDPVSITSVVPANSTSTDQTGENTADVIPGFKVHKTPVPVIRVDHLTFRYPTDQRSDENPIVLANLSFSLQAGERLGIMGPVGCGKSTLLHILAGLERSYYGSVCLWGNEVRRYPSQSLRSLVSIAEQRPFLFADTIRNNVGLGRTTVSDEEIYHYLAIAGLESDVSALARGLDTPLGEWGVNLSGGQKQRLTLARALAAKPQLLLLDDCLSAVDTVTEEAILRALDEHLQTTTLVWVAHRASTLRHCNHLLELA